MIMNSDSENFGKLLEYSTMTNGRLDWCICENYLELLDDFRKVKIKTFDFCITFEDKGKLISDIIDILESNLIILSPHEKSFGFSNLLEEVFEICEGYFQDTKFRDENSEVEVKKSEKLSHSS